MTMTTAMDIGGRAGASPDAEGFDPDELRAGARVLVQGNRGKLWKATVRGLRAKKGAPGFTIHYDGKRRGKLDWVPWASVVNLINIDPAEESQGSGTDGGGREKGLTEGEPEKKTFNDSEGKSGGVLRVEGPVTFDEGQTMSKDERWESKYREQEAHEFGRNNVGGQEREPIEGERSKKEAVGPIDSSRSILEGAKPMNKNEERWERRYRELVQFKNEEGHCKVPTGSVKFKTLGEWVRHQRHSFQRNGGTLPGNRATRLERIGFVWKIRQGQEKEQRSRATSKGANEKAKQELLSEVASVLDNPSLGERRIGSFTQAVRGLVQNEAIFGAQATQISSNPPPSVTFPVLARQVDDTQHPNDTMQTDILAEQRGDNAPLFNTNSLNNGSCKDNHKLQMKASRESFEAFDEETVLEEEHENRLTKTNRNNLKQLPYDQVAGHGVDVVPSAVLSQGDQLYNPPVSNHVNSALPLPATYARSYATPSLLPPHTSAAAAVGPDDTPKFVSEVCEEAMLEIMSGNTSRGKELQAIVDGLSRDTNDVQLQKANEILYARGKNVEARIEGLAIFEKNRRISRNE